MKLNRYFDKMCDEVEMQIRMEQKLKRNVTQGVILANLNSINAVQHVNLFSKTDYTCSTTKVFKTSLVNI